MRWRRFAAASLAALAGAILPGPLAAKGSVAGAEVSLAHGMLALQQEDPQEAARLFAEALRDDRHNGTARHWLGLAYLRLGRPGDAAAQLRHSLWARRPPAAGRARVLADLWQARRQAGRGPAAQRALRALRLALRWTEPTAATAAWRGGLAPAFKPLPEDWTCPPAGAGTDVCWPPLPPYEPGRLEVPSPLWEGQVGLAAAHDSNPGRVPEALSFTLPGATLLDEPSPDAAAQADFRLALQPFQDRHGWSLGLALTGQQSLYQEADDLDLSLTRGIASLAWGGDPRGYVDGPLGAARTSREAGRFSLLFQAGGGEIRLGGEPFLSLAQGAAALSFHAAPWSATRLDLTVLDRDFSADGQGALRQSGRETQLTLGQTFTPGPRRPSLGLAVAAGEREAGRAFAATFTELMAEASRDLTARWSLYLLAARREDRFDDPLSSLSPSGPRRDDITWRATATTAWAASERLSWVLQGSHVRRESNVALFAYRRTFWSLGAQWAF